MGDQPVMQQPGVYPMVPQAGAPYPPPGGQYPPPGGQYPPPGGQYPPAPPGAPPAMTWMAPPPQAPANCPPGLEYLTLVDQLLVKQKVELLEAFTGFESANKYIVQNSMGQQVFYAAEDTDCCTRQMCGNYRPFDMKILDNHQQEVMHFNRPYRCDGCCCPCCLMELEITAPPGRVIGFVKQDWSICIPKFTIYAADKVTPILKIKGPCCTMACCADVEFQVLDVSGENKVGSVTKQWTGFAREAFTDADNFGISFPMDLDVNAKASLLGALMLIDFMFFEQQNQNN